MLPIWGDDLTGKCAHGAPALSPCRACRDAAARDYARHLTSPGALVALVVLIAALIAAAPGAAQREVAFGRQQLQEHQQRLEAARPGAAQRLRELAAEVRARTP